MPTPTVVIGRTVAVYSPNMIGLVRAIMIPFAFFSGTIWTLEFECGKCGIVSTVQHDEEKKYHKCPVCKAINKLHKTTY